MKRSRLLLPVVGAVAALALASCASSATPAASTPSVDRIAVVTSTNVYAQLAEAVGGDAVEVTPIIASAAQDPHDYEAGAADQLTVSGAQLIIENGGGYDGFVDQLVEATGSTAPVVTAVESSHDWPGDGSETAETQAEDEAHAEEDHGHDHDHGHGHVEGFNEHIWYDPHTLVHVAEAIRDELITIDPAQTDAFTANADAIIAELDALDARLGELKTAHEGVQVMATEPVAGYLIADAGLDDVMPADFAEAVEEGQDVAPATLVEALGTIDSGTVRVLIANAQTGGAETTQVIDAAKAKGIPVLEFTESIPDGETYIQWMDQNISDLAAALGA